MATKSKKSKAKAKKDGLKPATQAAATQSVVVENSAPEVDEKFDEVFEADGVPYRFTAPFFIYKGKHYKAVEALEDPELLKELIERGFNILEEVDEEEEEETE